MEVVASLSQGYTAAAQCGLFTHKSVPVIFEPTCIITFSQQQCLHECSSLLRYTYVNCLVVCKMKALSCLAMCFLHQAEGMSGVPACQASTV